MNSLSKQRGVALLVTLVLLVVALILGLSSYQSSRLEEAMAGNYRSSTSAYMAAEFAAAEAWNDQFLGVIKAEDDDEGFVDVTSVLTQNRDEYAHLAGYYYYKEVSDGKYDVVAIGEVIQDPPVYRYIQFQSRLAIGPGSALLATSDGVDCPGDTSIVTANSGAFDVEGEEEVFGTLQSALQVGCYDAMVEVADSVVKNNETYDISGDPPTATCEDDSNSKLCNYIGGVQSEIDIDIFKNPDLMARFIDTLRRSGEVTKVNSLEDANGRQASDGITFVTATDFSVDASGNNFEYWLDESGVPISAPSVADMDPGEDGELTLAERQAQQQAAVDALDTAREVGGEAYPTNRNSDSIGCKTVDDFCVKQGGGQTRPDFSESGGFTGSGVLIVDGNAYFNGVPGFTGLIIVLGDYTVVGSGGGEFNGSVVSAPISASLLDSSGNSVDVYDESNFGSPSDTDTDYVAGLEDFDYIRPNIYPDLGSNVLGNSLSCWRVYAGSGQSACDYDKKIMQFSGGGNAIYNYDLEALENAVSMLDDALDSFGGVTTAAGDKKTPTELFAYGSGGDPLGYYAVNYRQSFDRPQVLSDYLDGNPDALPND